VAQLGEIGDALRAARWTWLAAAALASAATYPMAAVQLIGAAGTRRPAGRTIATQVASAAGGVLAPGGIGGAGVNVRYLERSGMGRAESVAAVTLANTAGFAVHVAALVTLGGSLTGTDVPPSWCRPGGSCWPWSSASRRWPEPWPGRPSATGACRLPAPGWTCAPGLPGHVM
jgi:hypothetical protein